MSVTVVIHFRAAEGNAAALLALLKQGRDFSLKAPGCEAFELYQSEDQPNRFVMVERWKRIEDHHANFAKQVKGSGHLEKIAALLAEPIHGGVHHLR